MKIFEIVLEADSTYEKGKAFGRRLVTPSEWFKKNNSDETEPELEPKNNSSQIKQQSVDINPNKLKDVVNSLLRDEPRYNEDIEVLKTLYSQLQDGSYTTTIDKSALMQTIKTAYSGGQLSKDDKTMLSKFAATL
jgi:hypothetical protein